jgi:hypothetical protein
VMSKKKLPTGRPLKPLFNPDDTFSDEGNAFAKRLNKILRPQLVEMLRGNYSWRDIERVACSEIAFICLFEHLGIKVKYPEAKSRKK